MKTRESRIINLVPVKWSPLHQTDAPSLPKNKKPTVPAFGNLHQLAFDNSLLANIITTVSNGKIIAANRAAAKLLGYSKKTLLTKYIKDLFSSADDRFKATLKERKVNGHVVGNLTAIKKSGKQLPCHITSVVFSDKHRVEKAITTLVDSSENIRLQKKIDLKKETMIQAEIIFAQSQSDATLNRLEDLEQKLDLEITAKEKLHSSSRSQQLDFEKERLEESKLKVIEIADAIAAAKQIERSDLGKELHDNVNQLLAASRLYLDIAIKNTANRKMYLNRSYEYTLNAIEEIRKLTKGLIDDVIKNLGLCDAIHNITQDIMEVYPIKIDCTMDNAIRDHVDAKFNLNVFRIVQEQLNNVIKHASATHISISLKENKSVISLSISDNGSGFDVTKNTNGIGIINIKSRAASFNGNARFVSEPGKGCVLTVQFPVAGVLVIAP